MTQQPEWRARYRTRYELFRARERGRLRTGIRNALILTVVGSIAVLALHWPPVVLLLAAAGWLFVVFGYLFRERGPEALDRTRLVAAAALPSGDVLVFDQHGHTVDELCGHAALKEEAIAELGPGGRFFTIDPSSKHYWEGGGQDSDFGTARLEVTLRAVQATAAEWATGVTSARQVAQATWRPNAGWSPAPDDIWLLIRDAALNPSLAPSEPGKATQDHHRPAPTALAPDQGEHAMLPVDDGFPFAARSSEVPAGLRAILATVTGWSIVGSRPECYETGQSSETVDGHPVTYFRSTSDPSLGFGALQQNASPQRVTGRRLSFGGLVRAEKVTGWAGLWVRLDGHGSGRPLAYESMRQSPLTGSTTWGRFSVAVDVPSDVTNIAYGVALHGQGTVWLADLGLRLVNGGVAEETTAPIGDLSQPQALGLSPSKTPSATPARPQREPVGQRGRVSGFEIVPPSDSPTFTQIGGMQAVKDQLARTVGLVLTDPVRAAQLKVAFNGVLLYGPLGTGKSLFARALAGEYGCNLVVATAGQAGGSPQEMARRLDEAFDVARSFAPAVLFFDEFDWLVTAPDRRPLLESLLDRLYQELQRAADAPRVVVVAATQAIDTIDPSAIRPGLFDLKIRVGLPDAAARAAILEAQLRDRPTDKSIEVSALAAGTDGLSAAALSAVVDAAALRALGRKDAGASAIRQEDLLEAIRDRRGRDRPALAEWSWDALVLPAKTKRELQELQRIIEDPGRAQRFGIVPPRGALLYGPPGTGKTTIARVLAAQARTSFYPIKGSDIVSKWLGESEQRVHDLFERARANRPSIVFVDEIDALGAARGAGDSGAMDRILNQLLQEIDGLESGTGVFVLGATNRRDLLDEALIRGGRLGRQIEIPNPDAEARTALLKSFTKAMPLTTALDFADLALRTEGMSGADLQQLCQQAAIHAMMRCSSDAAEVAAEDFTAALGEAMGRSSRFSI